MELQILAVLIAVASFTGSATSIDHDKVEPIPQPQAATVSEKIAIKFKPGFDGCASFPAVNAAGETSGGLKGTNGADECKVSFLGSQVYGRAGWYQDVWAIMHSCTATEIFVTAYMGYRVLGPRNNRSYEFGSDTSMRIQHSTQTLFGSAFLEFSSSDGEYQELIMWEQMTDEVRAALVDSNFDSFMIPFNEDHFDEHLKKAWPF
ncbi:unnamed protein product [Phytophthora lilii]|uniref:Unnamed protein product n=1 Tax=Phytophthora lilii TaxID=2077276 RepID=A0A9W6U9C7_9STRA|nr:unnamed protein product [Phytophthora lilii]